MPDSREIHVRPASQERDRPSRPLPPADPCALVIFGAAGDLTKRLVVPALYNLARTGVLPENFALIGVDRNDLSTEQWRDRLFDMLKTFVGNATSEFGVDRIDKAAWDRVASRMAFVRGVTFRSASATSRLKQVGQESVNTGDAPAREMQPAVAKKVKLGQITSSPGPIPSAISASRMPSVPEDTPMA